MTTSFDPGSCPLCGQSNQCAMVIGLGDGSPCWCTSLEFSAELLASLAQDVQGRVCICERCANCELASTPAAAQADL